jgi:hypothetical protein
MHNCHVLLPAGRQGSVVLMAKLLQGQQAQQGRQDQVAAVAAAVAAQGGAHVAQPAHANEMLAHGLTAHELLSELQHDSDGFTAGQTAVAAVLLQAWSEQLPLKSFAVAMQLLTARAQDLGVTLPPSSALHGLAPTGQAHAHAGGVVQGSNRGGKAPSALDLMAWSVSQSGGGQEGSVGATQVRRSPPSLAGQLPTSSSTGGYAGTAAGTPTASAAAGRTVASSGPSMSALGMGFVRGFLGIGSHSHHQKASSPPAAQGQGGSASGGTLGGVPAQLMQQLVVAELARMKVSDKRWHV